MKKVGITIIAAGSLGLSLSLEANEAQTATAVTIENPIKFSGSFYSGMKNDSSGKVTGGPTKTLIGPFVQPSLSLSTKGENYRLNIGYFFEAFGGNGIGGGFEANESKRIQDNAQFLNNPSVSLIGNFNDSLEISLLADYLMTTVTGNQTSNSSAMTTIADLKQKVSNRVTLGLGYSFVRKSSPDTLGLSERMTLGDGTEKSFANMSESEVVERFNNAFFRPTSNTHSGRAIAEVKIGESSSWRTHVQAGKIINVKANDVYTYRWNNDLITPITSDLSLFARYRLNFSKQLNSPDLGWAHIASLNLTYKLNEKWSVEALNTMSYTQSTKAATDESYTSENYFGVSYSF
jgi:hypothetical protein